MIGRSGEYRTEQREKMFAGDGTVKVEHFWEAKRQMRSSIRMCAKLTIPPGGSIGLHRHDQEEEIMVVISGLAEVNDNGKLQELKVGDTLLTGNGASHEVRCKGNEPLVLVAVIATY